MSTPDPKPTIPDFITTNKVAEITGRSPRTVEKDRLTGSGPPFYKFGRRVLYRLDEVLEWTSSRRRRSTADPGLCPSGNEGGVS